MKYYQLLSLEIIHTYYTDLKCPDFQITSTPATRKLLNNYRGTLKTFPGGIRVLLSISEDGNPFIPLSDDLTLTFYLQLQNPDFVLFTDIADFSSLESPLFTNNSVQAELNLSNQPVKSQRNPNVFADIEINFSAPQMRDLAVEKNFQIKFEAKSARWKYYVITDKNNATPAVEDGEKVITFDAEDSINPTDEIAIMLQEKYPDKGYYRFISSSLVPCQQSARKAIQLKLDGEKVVNALPNPSYQNFIIHKRDSQKEAELYHIVNYLTH